MKNEYGEWHFDIGNREVYFYRDEASKRNVFGLKVGNNIMESNFATDTLFEHSPEEYLASVFSFLEGHERVLKELGL